MARYFLSKCILLALGSAMLVASAPTPVRASEACDLARQVSGRWRFTTIVTEDPTKKAIGVNGYYEMLIVRSKCKLGLAMVKTGYSSHSFAGPKEQTGLVVLTLLPGESGWDGGSGGSFDIELENDAGSLSMRFELLFRGDELLGRWHYTGSSAAESPWSGVLVGKRGEGARVKITPQTLSCADRCDLKFCQEGGGVIIECMSNGWDMCRSQCR